MKARLTSYEREQVLAALRRPGPLVSPEGQILRRTAKERGCSVLEGQYEAFLVRRAMKEAEQR